MTQRDVDIERRRALIAMVRANLVELRYIEKRQGLRPARFDGRYELNAAAEIPVGERLAVAELEPACSASPSS